MNKKLKKFVIFLIISLFIGASITPSISSEIIKINNEKISSTETTYKKPNEPILVDSSGKTKFHGVFVGVPFDKEAQDLADALDKHPGWAHERKTVIKDDAATYKNISANISKLVHSVEPGEEVVIYFGTHGADNTRKDGQKDPCEGEKDTKDEPNKFDNHIKVADGQLISDDELRELIEGFKPCVTITVIIDSCYSGTMTDGKCDVDKAKNGPEGWEDPEPYGDDHLAVITASKTSTPTRTATQKSFTDYIIDGLTPVGKTTKADKDKNNYTNASEIAIYAEEQMKKAHKGDKDKDGKCDEDGVDYYYDPETGESGYLEIDNDGDGLIDEDLPVPTCGFWYKKEIFVDADVDPGGDGSINNPYNTIDEAIKNAVEGASILVSGGIYHEHIQTEMRHLELIGLPSGPYTPTGQKVIVDGDGEGTIIDFFGDYNTITGFEFRNCGSNEEDAAISLRSDYNDIFGNTFSDNQAIALYLHDSANYNYIHHNVIKDNAGAGIFIWQQSYDNYIFHNDFINNGWYNVKDKEGENIWNSILPYGGNYWDDYTGADSNGDGIGDTPYSIQGDTSQTGSDNYPWMQPHGWNNPPEIDPITGPTNGKYGNEYQYEFSVSDEHFGPGSDPFDGIIYCHVDWGDGEEEWFGPVRPVSVIRANHTWENEGNFVIQAQAFDIYEGESDTVSLSVSMPRNREKLDYFLMMLLEFPILYRLLKI